MDALLHDLRLAARVLLEHRATTALAALCLALGIGANAAICSVVRAVLLASLPYHAPDRLVRLYETFSRQGATQQYTVSVPNYRDWRERSRAFTDLAAFALRDRNVLDAADPVRLHVVAGTANLFDVLGAAPVVGRTFRPDEQRLDASPVVVLAEHVWRERFGADPRVFGRTLSLDGEAHTVVGVMAAAFDFPLSPERTDAWTVLRFGPERQNEDRTSYWLSVVGRLRPGVSAAAAAADLEGVNAQLRREHPAEMRDVGAAVRALDETVVGGVRPALRLLLGAAALVLLVACANVANLLLARGEGRRREVAVRTALGATRGRLVGQFLAESLLLALAGGALGLALGAVGLRLLLNLAAGSLPRADAVQLDGGVLLAVVLASLATGVFFGLVPALCATHVDLRRDLAEGAGRASGTRRHHRTLGGLVVAEIALSFTLLVGAGLLLRGFAILLGTAPGVERRNILTFHTSLPAVRYADSSKYDRFYGPALERLRALPGVRSAAATNLLPLQRWGMNGSFRIEGRPEEPDPTRRPFAEFRIATGDYFRTMGIAVVAGREFSDRDVVGSPRIVVINEDFARRYFPGERPIGRRIYAWDREPSTIVGVVRAVRQAGLDQAPRSEVYVAAAQSPRRLYDMTFAVATVGAPERLAPVVTRAVRAVAADLPVYRVRTMEQVVGESLATRRLTLVLLALFAGLALLLAAAGVYGVIAYGVSQRTREFGIRMALGARGRDVRRLVVGQGARLAALGLGLGLSASLALSRAVESLVHGVGARDPLTFMAVAGVLAAVALLASWLPALRASRVQPTVAMRAE